VSYSGSFDGKNGLRWKRRPRSSGDRARASGARCAGSNPAGGTGAERAPPAGSANAHTQTFVDPAGGTGELVKPQVVSKMKVHRVGIMGGFQPLGNTEREGAGTVESAESFLGFLMANVWPNPANAPALGGEPQTRILELADTE
jgi:hypothetical protein